MSEMITAGIKVKVRTMYQQDYSNPLQSEFLFAYHVTFEHLATHPIKVLKRFWRIFDSTGGYREVDAEGIVGLQPTIEGGTCYEYVSGCNLHSEMGSMEGYYTILNLVTKEIMKIYTPKIDFIYPPKLN